MFGYIKLRAILSKQTPQLGSLRFLLPLPFFKLLIILSKEKEK